MVDQSAIPYTDALKRFAQRQIGRFDTPGHQIDGNPGLASLKAAARPAEVDYLYYVRIPDTTTHFFTADESEFLRKVCEFGYACN